MSSPASVAAPLTPGAVFHGRYRIVRALKSGGMGSVYEVIDENTAAPRALKVMLAGILADADQRARFALEARVTGGIESDHLVRLSDSGVDEASGAPFLVMELLRGEELGDLVARRGALPPAEVITYLGQAALALDKTHAANIVHRDIKPDNLVVTRRDDGSPCVKILDFGIAKVVAQNQQNKTRALGTPLYMAPEQIRGESAIGPRADLYSLAQVAYTLITGEPYWAEEAAADGSLYTLLTKVLTGATEPPSTRAARRAAARGASVDVQGSAGASPAPPRAPGIALPPAFDAWFLKATSASPDGRFDRASAQVAALSEIFAAPPSSVVATPTERSAGTQALYQEGPRTGGFAQAPTSHAPPPPTTGGWPQAPAAPTPATTTGIPATQPSPGAPPPPPMPAVAAAPPRSNTVIVALAGVVAVLVIGIVVGAVLLLRGGGGGGSAASTGPIVGCPPNATCLGLDVSDTAHVDMQAAYAAVEKAAKSVDARGVLAMITGEVSRDGTADISGDKSLIYQWAIPGATLTAIVRGKTIIVQKLAPFGSATAMPAPLCSTKAAWKAAVAGGMPANAPATAVFSNDLSLGLAGWAMTGTKYRYFVDNKSCTVKASMKW